LRPNIDPLRPNIDPLRPNIDPLRPNIDPLRPNIDPLRPNPRINVTDISSLHLPHADIRIACSKGTYIRALARDIGEALGTGATLDSLRRTRSGGFTTDTALTIPQAMGLLTF
ncbi:MAG: hypothetical protein PUK70_06800, partial [Bacteroidales bacterium]|nr:hypothetical protein [Bacteroidales bacterium]